MSTSREKPYVRALGRLMAEKTKLISQAQAFAQVGLAETAQTLRRSAASLEERIAPRLDAMGRNREVWSTPTVGWKTSFSKARLHAIAH